MSEHCGKCEREMPVVENYRDWVRKGITPKNNNVVRYECPYCDFRYSVRKGK